MGIVFILLPLSVALASIAVAVFAWAARSGQFDDLDTPPLKIIFEPDEKDARPEEPLA